MCILLLMPLKPSTHYKPSMRLRKKLSIYVCSIQNHDIHKVKHPTIYNILTNMFQVRMVNIVLFATPRGIIYTFAHARAKVVKPIRTFRTCVNVQITPNGSIIVILSDDDATAAAAAMPPPSYVEAVTCQLLLKVTRLQARKSYTTHARLVTNVEL